MTFNEQNRHQVWVRNTIEKYESRLIYYATRITHDTHRAHDAVQETFLKLCQQDQNDLDGHLTEWLFTVCRNKSIDIRRKEKRMKTITEITNEPDQLDHNTPISIAGQNDENGFLMKLVSQLPEREREIIDLKFHEGLSYRQISRITGHSAAHVGHLLHQSLNSLKIQMKQKQT
jgi:RNA polymerase sigma factor (sigma-70 family)